MSNLVKYKIKNISELELQLFITIPKENIKKELNKEYENISSKIKINGFRIGKVPKNIIQQHYKINIIKTIFNKILKNSIDLVMKEKKLIPVSIPKIDSTDKFDINKNFSFTAIFYIKPKITIKKWKQLNLKISSYLITEKSIEKELKQIQMHYSKLITLKTRTIIKNNDFVKIKYKLITNESNYKKEKFIEKIIKIGNNSLYKEVDEALIGKTINNHLNINILLPNKDNNKKNKYNIAKLLIYIYSIKKLQIPELNNYFIKQITQQCSNLKELKTEIKEKLKIFKMEHEKIEKKNKAEIELMKINPIEIPSDMIIFHAKQILINTKSSLNDNNIEEKWNNIKQKWKNDFINKAQKRVHIALICDKIAENEKVIINNQALNYELEKEATKIGTNINNLKSYYTNADLQNIKLNILRNKAMDLVVNNANITINKKIEF